MILHEIPSAGCHIGTVRMANAQAIAEFHKMNRACHSHSRVTLQRAVRFVCGEVYATDVVTESQMIRNAIWLVWSALMTTYGALGLVGMALPDCSEGHLHVVQPVTFACYNPQPSL